MNPLPVLLWAAILIIRYMSRWKEMKFPSANEFESTSLADELRLSRPARYLRKLCYYLPRGEFKSSRGAYTFVSTYRGRAMEIEYRYAGTPSRLPELELKLPVTQKFWLRVVPQIGAPDEKEEVILGIPEVDARYRIWSDQPEAATTFLTESRPLKTISELPEFNRLEVHRGLFKILLIHPVDSLLKRSTLEVYLGSLIELIQFYDSQTLPLRITVDMSGRTLCPYCREKFQQSDEKWTCPGCRAALHAACRQENGHCTTWGCNSN